MKQKYEVIEIDNAQVTVDISLLSKTEEMFFNATEIAKRFGKQPGDFLRLDSTNEYINEILVDSQTGISRLEDLVRTVRGGRYPGTWLHIEDIRETERVSFQMRPL